MVPTMRQRWWEFHGVLRRRLWLILAVFALGAAASGLAAYRLPAVYEASTTIIVERQTLPNDYPGAVLVPRLEERLRVAQTFLTSDALIGRVLLRLGLVSAGQDSALEEAAESVRGRLEVRVRNLDSFRLSFQDRDPHIVMRVVNELTSEFIRENVAYSGRVVEQTSRLLTDERATIEARMREYEARVRTFRVQNRDRLPDRAEASAKVLERLQGRLEQIGRELREAQDRIPILERQAAVRPAPHPADRHLDELRAALAGALARYTEQHPSVQRLRREVDEAAARAQAAPAATLPPVATTDGGSLAASLELAQATVRGLEAERTEIVDQIRTHQARIDQHASVADEWSKLNRDYEALRERHQIVLQKIFESDLSRRVGSLQRDRFRVLDPATLPTRPVGPRRVPIAVAGVLLSAGLALTVAWAVDRVLDTSFHNSRSIEAALGLPVLAVVPTMRVTR
jgi:polysaccharide chain length determinant protein (PEP-CTERM system associated)